MSLVRGPRNTHSGPGGRPSICCSCRFRRKYPPTMYWVLPARPFLSSPSFLLPPSFRLFTFFHVAHVTGHLELLLSPGGGRGKKRRCIAAKVNEKKDGRARPAAFPNIHLRTTSKICLSSSSSSSSPPPPFFDSQRGGRVDFSVFTFVLGGTILLFSSFLPFRPTLKKNEKFVENKIIFKM